MNDPQGLAGIVIQTLYALYILLIFAMPVMLGYFFWHAWVKYVRLDFISQQKFILLEFRLPKEITKSPIAMEVFLNALYQGGGEGNWFDKYWKGGMRSWFSLELVSIEGQVKFFIWTNEKFKKIIESQLYSQYPDVEIAEVEDYAAPVVFDKSKMDLWGGKYIKSKDSHYPLKTYVDYGLDRDPKEELKIDPITPVIEYLGSLGAGEQAWIQILIRVHKNEMKLPGTWFQKVDWKHFAKEDVKAKMKRNKGEGESADRMTKGEKAVIEAIEKSISKFAFDAGIRVIYLAKKDSYNKSNQNGMRGIFMQFGSNDLNSLKTEGGTAFDYPWEDFMDFRLNRKKKEILDAYKKRAFFKPLFPHRHFVMTSEEIATLYHFPGKVAHTPTFTRINSKKAEAPSNLPI